MLECNREIKRVIEEKAWSVTNEDEKKYIEVFGWDRTRTQPGLCITGSIDRLGKFCDGRIPEVKSYPFCISYLKSNDRIILINDDDLPVNLRTLRDVDIEKETPLLCDFGREDSVKEFIETYPETWETLVNLFEGLVRSAISIDKKIQAMGEVFCRQDTTMTYLKTYIPELWKYGKEEEN